ncbi:MAG: heat shock protein 70 family, partial [Olpidium bornovanus]
SGPPPPLFYPNPPSPPPHLGTSRPRPPPHETTPTHKQQRRLTMSVVGIDFGNLQSIIAVARNRGIDVICNEVSNRATPSLVSFGPRQRFVGESAKTQEISNFRNTVGSLKRLVGRSFKDPEIASTEAAHINADLVEVEGGGIGVRVNYLGEEKVFSATQLVATYFSKLKDTILAETKQNVSSRPDVVISVPPWFTDNQRASIIDAADIAGLNCLRVMNDSTACNILSLGRRVLQYGPYCLLASFFELAALGYGITKADLPEEKARHVMFVDIGHSNCSVAVVAFKKGELTVKSTVWDRDFGGRNFDELLVDHFAREFKTRFNAHMQRGQNYAAHATFASGNSEQEKYNIDVTKNNKALFRLRTGCERLKKILSANSQAPLNIESIMEDKDVSSMLTRAEFETMSSQLLERVEPTLWKALKDAGLEIEDLDTLEVVGGCTRIPAVKERLASFIGREISTTLNQDEAVARGCALQCAIISPVFKVRDFAVNDIAPHPIKFAWKTLPGQSEADSQLDVFTRQQTVPSTKLLSFRRKEDFTVEACYADMSRLPPGTPEVVGRYHIKDVKPPVGEEIANVKLRARINLNGILSVEGAFLVEEVKTEEKDEAVSRAMSSFFERIDAVLAQQKMPPEYDDH